MPTKLSSLPLLSKHLHLKITTLPSIVRLTLRLPVDKTGAIARAAVGT
ncbi:hypothetical protein [Alloprevotella tannerae]|nr:hypothetical protein [Alloprevotella tannerae]